MHLIVNKRKYVIKGDDRGELLVYNRNIHNNSNTCVFSLFSSYYFAKKLMAIL